MRRHAFRALILAGALVAVSLPVVSGTLTPASACSNPGCTTSGGSTGPILDTYYSPITVTVGATTINEYQLTGEPTGPVTLPGNSLTISINDRRGNNEGWALSLTSGGLFCTDANFCAGATGGIDIPASDLQVTASDPSLVSCVGLCATAVGTGVDSTLDGNPVVAYACPAELIGMGLYSVPVTFNVNLSLQEAENFYFFPASYGGSFTATVDESLAPGSTLVGLCGTGVD
jgi:hypothetical protein